MIALEKGTEMKMWNFTMALAACAVLFTTLPEARASDAMPSDAASYCVKKGGVVQTRIPEYGTNGNNPLILSGHRDFCQFTSSKDGSHINLLLSTMFTKMPTLAALAYYAEVPYNGQCSGSPGSCYCSQIGGTDLFGGINAAGGGWVLNTDQNDVLDACIFPDLSSIDSYGLFYHSANVVRGKNLSKVLRYKNPYQSARVQQQRPALPF